MATDICEPQVIRALEKEGWHLVRKPLPIRTGERTLLADFNVQRSVRGNREEIIIIEVKCFTHPENDLQELYTAIGQYFVYQAALNLSDIELPLYLALPSVAYGRLVEDEVILFLFKNRAVKLLIVDIEKEQVTQWLN
jgi:hypothetical protein